MAGCISIIVFESLLWATLTFAIMLTLWMLFGQKIKESIKEGGELQRALPREGTFNWTCVWGVLGLLFISKLPLLDGNFFYIIIGLWMGEVVLGIVEGLILKNYNAQGWDFLVLVRGLAVIGAFHGPLEILRSLMSTRTSLGAFTERSLEPSIGATRAYQMEAGRGQSGWSAGRNLARLLRQNLLPVEDPVGLSFKALPFIAAVSIAEVMVGARDEAFPWKCYCWSVMAIRCQLLGSAVAIRLQYIRYALLIPGNNHEINPEMHRILALRQQQGR